MALHKACKDAGVSIPSSSELFKDFHNLQAVWTHPLVFAMKKSKAEMTCDDDNKDPGDDSDLNGDDISSSDTEIDSSFENCKQRFVLSIHCYFF